MGRVNFIQLNQFDDDYLLSTNQMLSALNRFDHYIKNIIDL